jgi:hypothetical protein
MLSDDFFQEIEHIDVPWKGQTIKCPVFFQDSMSLNATFAAPTKRVQALFPSTRMYPYRITPSNSPVILSTNMFRHSDLGPYNEVNIIIPFILDKPSPVFIGTLRKGPAIPNLYFHRMVVTTKIARDVGVEFSAFPKIVGEIEFEEDGEWLTCRMSDNGTHILTLSARKPPTSPVGRSSTFLFNHRNGYLLRSAFVTSEREIGVSRDPQDVRLELGDHPMADVLKDLPLGKMLGLQYSPTHRSVQTPTYESLKA